METHMWMPLSHAESLARTMDEAFTRVFLQERPSQQSYPIYAGRDTIEELEALLRASWKVEGQTVHVTDDRPEPSSMYTIF